MSAHSEPRSLVERPTLRGDEAGFLERIRLAFDLLRLRPGAARALADDDGAFASAAAVAALAGVAVAAGEDAGIWGATFAAVAWLLLSLAFTGAIHVVVRTTSGTDAGFVRLYRVLGHTYLAFWLAGIPLVHAALLWALWLWQLAASTVALERLCAIRRARAAAVVGGLAAAGLFLVLLVNGLLALLAMAVAWLL